MRTVLIIALILTIPGLSGQGAQWTLDQCIDQALKQSLDIKDAEIAADKTELNYQMYKLNMVPSLTGTAGQFYQAGRSIDRFTNTYVQKGISSSNYSISTSVFLYAAGQVRNQIKFGKYGWMATEADIKTVEQNISLNVANLFLQAALAKELVKSNNATLENTSAQLERAEKQFAAGTINEGQVLNLRAQKASNEADIVIAMNDEATAITSLKMLLRIPYDEPFDIQLPDLGNPLPQDYPETLPHIYASALSKRPEILAADLRVESSMYYKKYTRGAMYPSLSIGANLGTGYSSNALYIKDTIPGEIIAIGRVKGTNQLVEAQRINYDFGTIKYGEQLKNNLGRNVGLNLSIPIFNRFADRNAFRSADLDLEKSKLSAERTRQNLYNEVVSVYNAYNNSKNKYKASMLLAESQALNLEFVQKRFEGGQSSSTDLQIAKASESVARNNLVSAKYEYIFRKMILDFYMGKQFQLK